MKRSRKASAVVLVIMTVGILGYVLARMFSTSTAESRILQRRVPVMQTQNAVEGVLQFYAGKVREMFDSTGLEAITALQAGNISEIPDSLLDAFEDADVDPDSIRVAVEVSTDNDVIYLIPTTTNEDLLREKRVRVQRVTIYAKAASSANSDVVAHQSIEFLIQDTSFLEFAIFYDGVLEFFAATDYTINGPVHSNSNIWFASGSPDDLPADLTFLGQVTASGEFFAGLVKDGGPADSHLGDVWADNGDEISNDDGNFIDTWDQWLSNNPSSMREGASEFTPSEVPQGDGNNSYAMITPPVDASHWAYDASTEESKFANKAGLVIQISGDPTGLPTTTLETTNDEGEAIVNERTADSSTLAVTAYIPGRDGDGNVTKTAVTLPSGIFGRPDSQLRGTQNGGSMVDGEIEAYEQFKFYPVNADGTSEGYAEALDSINDGGANIIFQNYLDASRQPIEGDIGTNRSHIPEGTKLVDRVELKDDESIQVKTQQLEYEYPAEEYDASVKIYTEPHKIKYTIRMFEYTVDVDSGGEDFGGDTADTITVFTTTRPAGVEGVDYNVHTSPVTVPSGTYVIEHDQISVDGGNVNPIVKQRKAWESQPTWLGEIAQDLTTITSWRDQERTSAPEWYDTLDEVVPDFPGVADPVVTNVWKKVDRGMSPPDTTVRTVYPNGTPVTKIAGYFELLESDQPYLRAYVDDDIEGSLEAGTKARPLDPSDWRNWKDYETTNLNHGYVLEDPVVYTTGGVYDERQDEAVSLYYLDIAALKDALDNRTDEWGEDFDPSTNWNGILYVEFPTDDSAPERDDNIVPAAHSNLGLAVINGEKANIPSFDNPEDDPDNAYDDKVGFTLATNAPMYVIGDYNADGVIEDDSSTSAEDGEVPALLAADTVTFLSEGWGASGDYFSQYSDIDLTSLNLGDKGGMDLADYYDMMYKDDGTLEHETLYNNSGSMDVVDGVRGNRNAGDSRSRWRDPDDERIEVANKVVDGSETLEVSAAVIAGVPPSPEGGLDADGNATDETSGGVHNFFRFLEDWESNSVTIAYRGSILSLFEPEVHTALAPGAAEQWEVFRPGNRIYGYNELFQQTVPPGTPTGRTFRARSLRPVSASEFQTKYASYAIDTGNLD